MDHTIILFIGLSVAIIAAAAVYYSIIGLTSIFSNGNKIIARTKRKVKRGTERFMGNREK